MSEKKRNNASVNRRRKKRRKRSRFPQQLLTICILILALLCLVLLGRTFLRAIGKSPAGNEGAETVSQSTEVRTDQEEQEGQGEIIASPTPEMISLTEDMIHTGDLVLVNSGTLNYWHKIIVTELDRVEEGTRVRMEKAKNHPE